MLKRNTICFAVYILFIFTLISAAAFPSSLKAAEIFNEVYLLVKNDKLLAFSSLQNKWSEKDLRSGERVIESKYDGNVAVAYTQDRALAFSGITGRWSTERFRIHETVESLTAAGNVGTVITNIRALAFSAKTGSWVESIFDIHD